SRSLEQPGLDGAVRLERTVIIEMVAREIGEHCCLEAHAGDAMLIDRVRGDFHREERDIAFAQLGEPTMHGDGVRRGVGGRLERADAAETERTGVRGGGAQLLERSGDEMRRGRLAIGAGYAQHAHAARGFLEEAGGDRAEPPREPWNLDRLDMSRRRRRAHTRRRLPQDRSRAEGDRLLQVAQSMRACSGQRNEGAAGPHLAAVQRQLDDIDVRRVDDGVCEQRSQALGAYDGFGSAPSTPRCIRAHGLWLTRTNVVPGKRSRPSGGTPSRRKAPAMTLANTGAATSP